MTAAEGNDVAVRVFDIKVLCAPVSSRKRLDDRYAVGDALFVERFDAIDARRGVEMLVIAPPLAVRLVLGGFLEVELQSVQLADGVKAAPRVAEAKTEFAVVVYRAFEVIDKDCGARDVTRGRIVIVMVPPFRVLSQ